MNSTFEKQDFNENFICEKNRFDSVCSTESHRSFTFRAYFKKHDSEANLFIGNRCFKWSSFEKKNQNMRQSFTNKLKFWIEFFLTSQILNWRFIVPEDIENKDFRIIIFQRKIIFDKIMFWIQFLRNKISMKKSHLKKSFWLNLLSRKQQIFHFSCLFEKAWFWSELFHWKSDFENDFFEKKIRFWSKFFLTKREFEWKFLQLVRFWIESISSCQISKNCLHPKVTLWFIYSVKTTCFAFLVLFEKSLFCIEKLNSFELKKIQRVRLPNKFFRLVRFWKKNYKVSDFKLKKFSHFSKLKSNVFL